MTWCKDATGEAQSWSQLMEHSRWGDGPVALLPGCIPNLRLYRLAVHLNAAGRELDPDRAFTLQVKLVAGESRQQVTLPDARVSDKNNYKWTKSNGKSAIFYALEIEVWSSAWCFIYRTFVFIIFFLFFSFQRMCADLVVILQQERTQLWALSFSQTDHMTNPSWICSFTYRSLSLHSGTLRPHSPAFMKV